MSEYERIIEYVNGLDDISIRQLQMKFDLSYSEALEYKVRLITDDYLTLNIIECSECGEGNPEYKYEDEYYCEKCMLIEAGIEKVEFTDFYYTDASENYLGSSDDYTDAEMIEKELDGKVEYCEYGFD